MRTSRRWTAVAATVAIAAGVFALVVVAPWYPHGGGTTQAAQDDPSPQLRRSVPLRVMPLGDSITEGNGAQVPGAYRPYLFQLAQQSGAAIDFVGSQTSGPANLSDRNHEGHPGWQIQQLDSQITSWVRTYRPDVVLLHAGTNNVWRPGELPTLAPDRLSTLIDHITAADPAVGVYVAAIVPSAEHDAKVRQFNEAVSQLVAAKVDQGARIELVDQYSALTSRDLIDGIHPNAGGYEKMARRWWQALRGEF